MEGSIALIKHPTAWLPMGMSVAILALVLSMVTTLGVMQYSGSGATSQMFQFWIAAESSMIAFFGFKWIPQMPLEAQWVMLGQILFALIPLAIVFT